MVFHQLDKKKKRHVDMDQLKELIGAMGMEMGTAFKVLSPRTLSPFYMENTSVQRKGV